MSEQDRIRLAEALGLYHNWNDKTIQAIIDNFQPDTDANDCDALIRHMIDNGYAFCIEMWRGRVWRGWGRVCWR